jgi:hypothetical protein
MEETAKGWKVLDREGAILWRQYSFGPGLATTFVFRGAGDGLIVVSPGSGLEGSVLDELQDFGKVVALVASNAYHWLGQPLWRKRFPEARSFAPAQGLKRLSKKMPELGPFEPLAALAPLLGDHAQIAEGPGHRVGNAYATVRGKSGAYWYPSDVLSNMPLTGNVVVRTLLSMTNSAPGYRLFRPSIWLQVNDKAALRAWIEDELARSAPVAVVPAHGRPVTGSDLIASTRALVAAM